MRSYSRMYDVIEYKTRTKLSSFPSTQDSKLLSSHVSTPITNFQFRVKKSSIRKLESTVNS